MNKITSRSIFIYCDVKFPSFEEAVRFLAEYNATFDNEFDFDFKNIKQQTYDFFKPVFESHHDGFKLQKAYLNILSIAPEPKLSHFYEASTFYKSAITAYVWSSTRTCSWKSDSECYISTRKWRSSFDAAQFEFLPGLHWCYLNELNELVHEKSKMNHEEFCTVVAKKNWSILRSMVIKRIVAFYWWDLLIKRMGVGGSMYQRDIQEFSSIL